MSGPYLNDNLQCCGIRELYRISDLSGPEAFRTFAVRFSVDNKWRYGIFSEANGRGYGEDFAAYITQHKLGVLTQTEWNINPNTDNRLKVWLWTLDREAIRDHAFGIYGIPIVLAEDAEEDEED